MTKIPVWITILRQKRDAEPHGLPRTPPHPFSPLQPGWFRTSGIAALAISTKTYPNVNIICSS